MRNDAATIRISRTLTTSKPRVYYHLDMVPGLTKNYIVYSPCVANIEKALLTRVYIDIPQWRPDPVIEKICQVASSKLSRQIEPEYNFERLQQDLAKFPAKKRERYTEALKAPYDRKSARVTGFPKTEFVPLKPEDKPRMIQFRGPGYLAHLLPAMKPLEHAFYHGRYLFNRYQKITCAKGLDHVGRMRLIEKMVSDLENPVYVGLDGSAFDAHVGVGALKLEWRFYDQVWRKAGYSRETIYKMKKMGRQQLRNKCFAMTDDGHVRYVVEGNRMSGDLNTGLGNSVLQSIYITYVMQRLGIPERHWRMLVDGDDSILLISGRYRALADQVAEMFKEVSQEVKVEGPYDISLETLEVVDFCQSRPVRLADGSWRLVRNPFKVYNGYCRQTIWLRSREELCRYYATISPPEMIFARGVPVLQALFAALHLISGDSKPVESVSNKWFYRNCMRLDTRLPVQEINAASRMSFSKAFGISELDQLIMEQELGRLSPSHIRVRPDPCF